MKLLRQWDQIPPNEVGKIAIDTMNEALHWFSTGQKRHHSISTQLFLAIVAIVLRGTPESWKDPISDLLLLAPQSLSSSLAVLHILSLLPEEFHGNSTAVTNSRRSLVGDYLTSGSVHVLSRIISFIVEPSMSVDIKRLSLNCLLSWLTLPLPNR
jgi:hypothetical protein